MPNWPMVHVISLGEDISLRNKYDYIQLDFKKKSSSVVDKVSE